MLHDVVTSASILLEGQLGALCDPDYGIYPHTSSSPLAGYAAVKRRAAQHGFIAVTVYSSSAVQAFSPAALRGMRQRTASAAATPGIRRQDGPAADGLV